MLLVRGMIQIWDGIAITLVKVKDNDMCVVGINCNKQTSKKFGWSKNGHFGDNEK